LRGTRGEALASTRGGPPFPLSGRNRSYRKGTVLLPRKEKKVFNGRSTSFLSVEGREKGGGEQTLLLNIVAFGKTVYHSSVEQEETKNFFYSIFSRKRSKPLALFWQEGNRASISARNSQTSDSFLTRVDGGVRYATWGVENPFLQKNAACQKKKRTHLEGKGAQFRGKIRPLLAEPSLKKGKESEGQLRIWKRENE